jgi:hypothetical protein
MEAIDDSSAEDVPAPGRYPQKLDIGVVELEDPIAGSDLDVSHHGHDLEAERSY